MYAILPAASCKNAYILPVGVFRILRGDQPESRHYVHLPLSDDNDKHEGGPMTLEWGKRMTKNLWQLKPKAIVVKMDELKGIVFDCMWSSRLHYASCLGR